MDVRPIDGKRLEELMKISNKPAWMLVRNMPTIDVVSKGLFDQIKWERDVAIEQLKELGLSFGQKIDGIYLTKEELLKYKKVSNLKHKPYTKVLVNNDFYGACAIYEKHPFGDGSDWCWVYYDWCGNPVGLSKDMPKGEVVDKFTAENLGSQSLADYLNKEPAFKTA